MTYNLTNMTNGMNPVNIIMGINAESAGLFSLTLLMTSMFVLVFIIYYQTGSIQTSTIIASFAGLLLALVLWTMGIVGFKTLLIPTILLIITLFMGSINVTFK